MAKPNPSPEETVVTSEDAPASVEVPVARAPSLSREEIMAMGLDPAPYGYPTEDKVAE